MRRCFVRGLGRLSVSSAIVMWLAITVLLSVLGVRSALYSHPLGSAHPDAVFVLGETDVTARQEMLPLSLIAFEAISSSPRFRGVAAAATLRVSWYTAGDVAERVVAEVVTRDFFEVLGIQPVMGRTFDAVHGGTPECMISEALWRARFGSASTVTELVLRTSEGLCSIVGVAPQSAAAWPSSPDLWLPLASAKSLASNIRDPAMKIFTVVARRADDTGSVESRALAIDDVAALTYRELTEFVLGARQVRTLHLITLLGVSVALAAVMNLALFCYGQLLDLRPQLALMVALGASTKRLLAEHIARMGVALVVGSLAGWWTTTVLLRTLVSKGLLPAHVMTPPISWSVLTCLSVGLVALVATTAVLHWFVGAPQLTPLLRGFADSSSRTSIASQVLFTTQVTAATATAAISAALMTSLWQVTRLDPGYDPREVLVVRATVAPGVATNWTLLEQSLVRHPFVKAGGITTDVPVVRLGDGPLLIEGTSVRLSDGRHFSNGDPRTADLAPGVRYVTDGFFGALGIQSGNPSLFRHVRGGPLVAVVSQDLARRYWPGEDPVGQRFTFARRLPKEGALDWITVIGTIPPVRFAAPDRPPRPEIFLPITQHPRREFQLVIKRGPVTDADLRAHLSSLSRQFALDTVSISGALSDAVYYSTIDLRYAGSAGIFFTLFTAAMCLLALASTLTRQIAAARRHIAIQKMLGGLPRQIRGAIERRWQTLATLGVASGLLAAHFSSRTILHLFGHDISPARTVYPAVGLASLALLLVSMRLLLVVGIRNIRFSLLRH